MKKQVFVLTCLLAISCSAALAKDPLGIEVAASFYGKYIWRGQNITDEPVFQPAVTLSRGPISGGVWANMDLTNVNDQSGKFTEYDYWLDYSAILLEGVGFSLGTIHYYFPGLPSTTEPYWGLNFDLPLSPAIKIYHDVDQVNGIYAAFSLGHTVEKLATWSDRCYCDLTFGASIGCADSDYNEFYWNVSDSAFNDLTLAVALPVCLGRWTVTPNLNYVTLLDSDIRASDAYDTSSDYLFAGIALGTIF